MSRIIIYNTYGRTRSFDRSLLYLIFFPKILHTNTFINDSQKLYTEYPTNNIFIPQVIDP